MTYILNSKELPLKCTKKWILYTESYWEIQTLLLTISPHLIEYLIENFNVLYSHHNLIIFQLFKFQSQMKFFCLFLVSHSFIKIHQELLIHKHFDGAEIEISRIISHLMDFLSWHLCILINLNYLKRNLLHFPSMKKWLLFFICFFIFLILPSILLYIFQNIKSLSYSPKVIYSLIMAAISILKSLSINYPLIISSFSWIPLYSIIMILLFQRI